MVPLGMVRSPNALSGLVLPQCWQIIVMRTSSPVESNTLGPDE
jgi:hypothetical protein